MSTENLLLDQLDASEMARRKLVEACTVFRDTVLNQRGPLEAPCLDNDQTNAVLAAYDDEIGKLLTPLSNYCPRCGTRTNVSPCYNCGDNL